MQNRSVSSLRETEPSEQEWFALQKYWKDRVCCLRRSRHDGQQAWRGFYYETFLAGQAGYCPECFCSVEVEDGSLGNI